MFVCGGRGKDCVVGGGKDFLIYLLLVAGGSLCRVSQSGCLNA